MARKKSVILTADMKREKVKQAQDELKIAREAKKQNAAQKKQVLKNLNAEAAAADRMEKKAAIQITKAEIALQKARELKTA
jgi:transposase-like protein